MLELETGAFTTDLDPLLKTHRPAYVPVSAKTYSRFTAFYYGITVS